MKREIVIAPKTFFKKLKNLDALKNFIKANREQYNYLFRIDDKLIENSDMDSILLNSLIYFKKTKQGYSYWKEIEKELLS